MTLHEINLVIRGYRSRLMALQAIAGWHANVTLQPWMKHPQRVKPPFMPPEDE